MFVGHYSTGFVGKAVEPRVPLWVLLVAAQLVDIVWAGLVLGGIERFRIDLSLPSNPLDLYDMPYTHSLAGALAWSVLAGALVRVVPRLGGTRRAAVVVGLVVLSHWVLDLIVHRPDLSLWGGGPKVGLGLWNLPLVSYVVEIALVTGAATFYVVHRRLARHAGRAVLGLLAALVLLQTFASFGPTPASVRGLVCSVLAVFIAVPYAAARVERRIARVAARKESSR
jgi:hypothetical protein